MAALGVLVGLVARAWFCTLRLRVSMDPVLLGAAPARPWVLGFLHGHQWPLLAWKRRRPTAVLVSHSRDGSLQARALRIQGLVVVRGSSSKGGARALVGLIRHLRAGMDAAFAVDGPRGPRGVVKGGVVAAARGAKAWLVPVGSATSQGVILDRAWDAFRIAWPFSRVQIVFGAPIDPEAPNARLEMQEAILAANAAAEQSLEGAGLPARAARSEWTRALR
jgi:lysophospholipid acyltransferase (LPLAT)-like uncharacterized protein